MFFARNVLNLLQLTSSLKLTAFTAVLGLTSTLGSAQAALVGTTSFSAFQTAITGRTVTTVNFDSSPAGTALSGSTFQQIAFPAGNNLIITDGDPVYTPNLQTISGLNYVGNDIDQLILDTFQFNFQTPANSIVNGVGLYVISPAQLAANDVGLRVGGTSVFIDFANPLSLPSAVGSIPSFAYFLGITSDQPFSGFTNVEVAINIPLGFEGIGIDNITYSTTAVPEPSSVLLLGATLLGAGYRIARRKPSVSVSNA